MGDKNIILESSTETQRNQNASVAKQNPEAYKDKFVCAGCSFSCNSFVNFKMHMQQTNHESAKNIPQDPSKLNKPGNQNVTAAKEPETQKMNIVKQSEPQVTIVKPPEYYKMTIVKPPELRKMNIVKPPEPQKMNIVKYPDSRKFNTGKNSVKLKTAATKTLGSLSEQIRRSIFSLRDYVERTDREPLIGLEYVVEYRVQNKANRIEPKYICEVCDLDSDLVPMVEHLAGFRHRKLYLAKEYPYVLKAPSSSKEDRSQFMRRMALEIEREEGTKMYKIDPVVKNESMNLRTLASIQAKRRTRWDTEGNNQIRMNKALEYLESFEIDNDIEATTVTRLIEKLRHDMDSYSIKRKEEALFPARVARAKDVAMAIMQNVPREKMVSQNFVQQNQAKVVSQNFVQQNQAKVVSQNFVQQNQAKVVLQNFVQQNQAKVTPPFNRRPPENTNMQSAHPGSHFLSINKPQKTQSSNIPQKPQQFPPEPAKQKQNTAESTQKTENAGSSQTDLNMDDVQFLKKLMALLKCIPQSTPSSDNLQINSKLMMLKTLMVDQTSTFENPLKNQQMMMQLASLTQDTAKTDNISLNQLMMMMNSQNTTAMQNVLLNQQMMMNMTNVTDALCLENSQQHQNTMVGNAGMGQNTGQMNRISLMNMNQNVQNQEYGQMGRGSDMLMEQNAYQDHMDMQPECSNTLQNYGNFGYDRSLERNYLPHADSYNCHDNMGESEIYRANEQAYMPYADRNYVPDVHGSEWSEPSYGSHMAKPMHVDTAGMQAPYTRVSLSPNKVGPGSNIHDNNNSRSFDFPEWSDGESGMQHKRPRLDMEHIPPRFSEKDHRGFHQPHNINASGLTPDILKRIQGKDLFTVSAILSEYAENQPSE